jgi:excisionase family DNA binding protein
MTSGCEHTGSAAQDPTWSGRSPEPAAKQRTRDRVSSAGQPIRTGQAFPVRRQPLTALDSTGSGPLSPASPRDGAASQRLLTARTVADMLDVCTETVLRWIRLGHLPAIRLPGGAIRIAEPELHVWLFERATPSRGVLATTPDAAEVRRYLTQYDGRR